VSKVLPATAEPTPRTQARHLRRRYPQRLARRWELAQAARGAGPTAGGRPVRARRRRAPGGPNRDHRTDEGATGARRRLCPSWMQSNGCVLRRPPRSALGWRRGHVARPLGGTDLPSGQPIVRRR